MARLSVQPTSQPVVTGHLVDRDNTRFFDDAVKLWREDTITVLHVHITDVTERLTLNVEEVQARLADNPLKKEWRELESMLLPEESIEDFGLKPSDEVAALSIELRFNETLNVTERKVFRSRFTAESVTSFTQLDEARTDALHPDYLMWNEYSLFASLVSKKRMGVPVEPGQWVPLTSQEDVEQIFTEEIPFDADCIIEELMLLANYHFSQFCFEHDIPCIYTDYVPTERYRKELEIATKQLLPGADQFKDYLLTLECPVSASLEKKYSLRPQGHYALFFKTYGYFTSPIRRVTDYLNQILLFRGLEGQLETPELRLDRYVLRKNLQIKAKDTEDLEVDNMHEVILRRIGFISKPLEMLVQMDAAEMLILLHDVALGYITYHRKHGQLFELRMTAEHMSTHVVAKLLLSPKLCHLPELECLRRFALSWIKFQPQQVDEVMEYGRNVLGARFQGFEEDMDPLVYLINYHGYSYQGISPFVDLADGKYLELLHSLFAQDGTHDLMKGPPFGHECYGRYHSVRLYGFYKQQYFETYAYKGITEYEAATKAAAELLGHLFRDVREFVVSSYLSDDPLETNLLIFEGFRKKLGLPIPKISYNRVSEGKHMEYRASMNLEVLGRPIQVHGTAHYPEKRQAYAMVIPIFFEEIGIHLADALLCSAEFLRAKFRGSLWRIITKDDIHHQEETYKLRLSQGTYVHPLVTEKVDDPESIPEIESEEPLFGLAHDLLEKTT